MVSIYRIDGDRNKDMRGLRRENLKLKIEDVPLIQAFSNKNRTKAV
jgi:hypothetical protein